MNCQSTPAIMQIISAMPESIPVRSANAGAKPKASSGMGMAAAHQIEIMAGKRSFGGLTAMGVSTAP